jgi:hypothetical protein
MRISSNLLDDTLKLFQLARETARINGQPNQVERLTPLVENLTTLVTKMQAPSDPQKPDPSSTVMGQEDFKTLLATIQSESSTTTGSSPSSEVSLYSERSYIVNAMANGGMSALDIARQMGMTTDEVQMVLSLNKLRSSNT